jgi:hypothetical protein
MTAFLGGRLPFDDAKGEDDASRDRSGDIHFGGRWLLDGECWLLDGGWWWLDGGGWLLDGEGDGCGLDGGAAAGGDGDGVGAGGEGSWKGVVGIDSSTAAAIEHTQGGERE